MSNSGQQLSKRLFSVPEVAVDLGRTPCAAKELIWAGKVLYVRLDRRVFLAVKDLDHFIDEHKAFGNF